LVSAFEGELARMRDTLLFTGREVGVLSNGISGGLRRAFDGLVFDGLKLSEALKGIGQRLADTVYGIAMRPVQNAVGGFLANGLNGLLGGMMPFEAGGTFSQGRLMPFAKGGVVAQATAFPMRGGTGLMGEAGPEAIMPLTRGRNGKLGVQAAGGSSSVMIALAPGLEASILRQARGQAIQIVQAGNAAQQRGLGASLQDYDARGTT